MSDGSWWLVRGAVVFNFVRAGLFQVAAFFLSRLAAEFQFVRVWEGAASFNSQLLSIRRSQPGNLLVGSHLS